MNVGTYINIGVGLVAGGTLGFAVWLIYSLRMRSQFDIQRAMMQERGLPGVLPLARN